MNTQRAAPIISLEAELGARGGELAQELSRLLRLPVYDSAIVEAAAALSAIPKSLLLRYEERLVKASYDLSAQDVSGIHLPPPELFYAAQIAACRALAEKGSCILVDHNSNLAMSGRADCLRLFVHAEREKRLADYARRRQLSIVRVRGEFEREEAQRRQYYRYAARHWGEAKSYDLSVDSGLIEPKLLAASIAQHLQTLPPSNLCMPPGARSRQLIREANIIYLHSTQDQNSPHFNPSIYKERNISK